MRSTGQNRSDDIVAETMRLLDDGDVYRKAAARQIDVTATETQPAKSLPLFCMGVRLQRL